MSHRTGFLKKKKKSGREPTTNHFQTPTITRRNSSADARAYFE